MGNREQSCFNRRKIGFILMSIIAVLMSISTFCMTRAYNKEHAKNIRFIRQSERKESSVIDKTETIKKHNYKPEKGYVADKEIAVNIAKAVWISIYGKEQIEREKPYKAFLKEGVWYIEGSLPEGWLGGVAEAEIAKDDGHIIRISHGE
jgi:hypothetical protein